MNQPNTSEYRLFVYLYSWGAESILCSLIEARDAYLKSDRYKRGELDSEENKHMLDLQIDFWKEMKRFS